MANLTKNAGGAEVRAAENNDISPSDGIITKISKRTFGDTYRSLRDAIQENSNLTILTQLNHRQNALDVGMELDPTRLIIFGNPSLGSPLMQNSPTTALDLPQKMLVWRDAEDQVHVSYNDPEFLKKRHGLEENDQILETIASALENLSNIATGN